MSLNHPRFNKRNLHTRRQETNQRQDENGAICDGTKPEIEDADDGREEWERYQASLKFGSQPR